MTTRFGQNPVLILAFNRPELAAQLLAKVLERYRPLRLYFAVDGPRAEHPADIANIKRVTALVDSVPKETTVFKLLRTKNLGCRLAIPEAINWFFENETAGIILEDDIDPSVAFFRFCDAGLTRFENDLSILHINGYVSVGDYPTRIDSLYRTTFPHPWGWATWRRAWRLYDDSLLDASRETRRDLIASAVSDPDTRRFYDLAFELAHQRKLDAWDYPWMLSCWKHGGAAITPAGRLAGNKGIGADSTHSWNAPHLCNDKQLEVQPKEGAALLNDRAMTEQFHRYFQGSSSRYKRVRMFASTLAPREVHRFFRRIRGHFMK